VGVKSLRSFVLRAWHGFRIALRLGRVDMSADGVGGLSWGFVINHRIGGRQCFKMLNSCDGLDFQFVRDCVQW
jgi:hypothetical protein